MRGTGSLMTRLGSSGESPAQALAGAQRHEHVGAERKGGRDIPTLRHQRDRVAVAWQAIEVRAVERGKCLESFEGADTRESLGVELDAGMRRENPGAATAALLRRACVRRA